MTPLSPELAWLVWTALLTSLLWIPYILKLLAEQGVLSALMDGEHVAPPQAPWSQRAKRAHTNAVENLVVFAPLVLAVEITEANSALTATACAIFFYARLGHYVVYTLGLPVIRTLLFAVGWVCQILLGYALLA